LKGELFNTTKWSFDVHGEVKEESFELSIPGRDFNSAGSCAIQLKNRMFIFGGLERYKHQVKDSQHQRSTHHSVGVGASM